MLISEVNDFGLVGAVVISLASFGRLFGDEVAPRMGSAVPQVKGDAIVETLALPYLTVMLARDPAIQEELGLKRRQVGELQTAVAEVDQPLWILRDVPVKNCAGKLDALLATFRQQLQHILTPAELQRLDELILQARGYKALVSDDAVQRLKLSADQVRQLKMMIDNTGGRPRQVEKKNPARPTVARPASQAAPQADDSAIVAKVLSLEQLVTLTDMIGKPFDLRQVRRIACDAPELRNAHSWINSEPLTLKSLRGKVVVVHFWAFGCINCVHNLPHYKSWHETFPKSELTIIGIHTPETERERSVDNLRGNIEERGIAYPVAVDTAAENWQAWGNHLWPSVYLIDKQGHVRAWWYGELNWQGGRGEEAMRKKIQALLAEKPSDNSMAGS